MCLKETQNITNENIIPQEENNNSIKSKILTIKSKILTIKDGVSNSVMSVLLLISLVTTVDAKNNISHSKENNNLTTKKRMTNVETILEGNKLRPYLLAVVEKVLK
jgi:hypothetical protein